MAVLSAPQDDLQECFRRLPRPRRCVGREGDEHGTEIKHIAFLAVGLKQVAPNLNSVISRDEFVR